MASAAGRMVYFRICRVGCATIVQIKRFYMTRFIAFAWMLLALTFSTSSLASTPLVDGYELNSTDEHSEIQRAKQAILIEDYDTALRILSPLAENGDPVAQLIDAALEQDVFYLAQRKWVPDVHHHREANDLGRRVERTGGVSHPTRLRTGLPNIKAISFDNAVERDYSGSP